jgi:hypothetical protein
MFDKDEQQESMEDGMNAEEQQSERTVVRNPLRMAANWARRRGGGSGAAAAARKD